jgi:hypothetical protein
MLTSGVAGDEPIFTIPTLPLLSRSHEEAKLLTDISRPILAKLLRNGTRKSLHCAWPAAGLWTKKEEIDCG